MERKFEITVFLKGGKTVPTFYMRGNRPQVMEDVRLQFPDATSVAVVTVDEE